MPAQPLPNELAVAILSLLFGRDILSFCSTSHYYWDLFKRSPQLQLLVELCICGAEDNPGSQLGLNERLTYLRRLERNWRDLTLDRKVGVARPYQQTDFYVLMSGHYFTGDAVQGETQGFRGLNLRQIQYPNRNTSSWSFIPFQHSVLDVAVELEEQDLVVVLLVRPDGNGEAVYQMQFLQFSTGKTHPSAATPISLLSSFQANLNSPTGVMEVSGSLVLLLTTWDEIDHARHDNTLLYDWKRDAVIWEDSQAQGSCGAASFLSPTEFIIARMEPAVLILYSINNTESESPHVQAVRVLSLPKLRPGACINNISLDGYPCPLPSAACGGAGSPGGPPMSPSSRAAVVIVTLAAYSAKDQGSHQPRMFGMVVHRQALLDAGKDWIGELQRGDDAGVARDTPWVPWINWGPRITRWDEKAERGVDWPYTHAVFGQRRVFLNNSTQASRITMRDYNPHNVRRALSTQRSLHSRMKVVTKPSEISGRGCFERITSSLPFLEVVSDNKYSAQEIMMDDQHIVLIPEEVEDTNPEMVVFLFSPQGQDSEWCKSPDTSYGKRHNFLQMGGSWMRSILRRALCIS